MSALREAVQRYQEAVAAADTRNAEVKQAVARMIEQAPPTCKKFIEARNWRDNLWLVATGRQAQIRITVAASWIGDYGFSSLEQAEAALNVLAEEWKDSFQITITNWGLDQSLSVDVALVN